jgi:hypothetical protein
MQERSKQQSVSETLFSPSQASSDGREREEWGNGRDVEEGRGLIVVESWSFQWDTYLKWKGIMGRGIDRGGDCD